MKQKRSNKRNASSQIKSSLVRPATIKYIYRSFYIICKLLDTVKKIVSLIQDTFN